MAKTIGLKNRGTEPKISKITTQLKTIKNTRKASVFTTPQSNSTSGSFRFFSKSPPYIGHTSLLSLIFYFLFGLLIVNEVRLLGCKDFSVLRFGLLLKLETLLSWDK